MLLGVHERAPSASGAPTPATDLPAGSKEGNSFLVTTDGQHYLFFGIIDILTDFNIKKKLEYGIKLMFLGKTISCVPPDYYAERFYDFLKDVVFSENKLDQQNLPGNSIWELAFSKSSAKKLKALQTSKKKAKYMFDK